MLAAVQYVLEFVSIDSDVVEAAADDFNISWGGQSGDDAKCEDDKEFHVAKVFGLLRCARKKLKKPNDNKSMRCRLFIS